ncbi:MAG: aromatic ring-hydroxylating oxygenase subunit alpha [Pseudonocardiaceae bacterium]
MTHFVTNTEIAGLQDPLEAAFSLPPSCYWSEDFFHAESRHIFQREWICVGRAEEVAGTGNYLCAEIAGEPVVVVRTESGEVKALSPVCRHRWMVLVEGRGTTSRFQCPYHLWTYALDGRLTGAPYMNRSVGFAKDAVRLPEFRTEQWEGFLYVNLDLDAAPLAPRLTGLTERLTAYGMGDLRIVESLDWDCDWNWKFMVENFMECYHHIGLHADTMEPLTPARLTTVEGDDGWALGRMPFAEGADSMPVLPPIEGLTDADLRQGLIFVAYPCHLVVLFPDHLVSYVVLPHGPERFTLRTTICAPASSTVSPSLAVKRRQVREAFIRVHEEDIRGCRGAQRGVRSAHARPGRLSHLESAVQLLGRYVFGCVTDAGSAGGT